MRYGLFFLMLFFVGCATNLEYKGRTETNGILYEAKVVVSPSQGEGKAFVKITVKTNREVNLQRVPLDLISPLGAQSVPLQLPEVSCYLLSQASSAMVKMKWRMVNDPSSYQLYGLAGEPYPRSYTLSLGGMVGESVSLVVEAKSSDYQRYSKGFKPVIGHYKVVFPSNFQQIQWDYLVKNGWITRDHHEEEGTLRDVSFIFGDQTVVMNGMFYVGWYAFATSNGMMLRVVFANREVDKLLVVPERIRLRVAGREITPRVVSESLPRSRDGVVVYRGQRGDWLLWYSIPLPPEEVDVLVREAFLSDQKKPFFADETIHLARFSL